MIKITKCSNVRVFDCDKKLVTNIDNNYDLESVGIITDSKIERKIDLEKRFCYVHKNKFILNFTLNDNLTDNYNPEFYFNNENSWKLLKYEKGCFFESHTDKQVSKNHTHTALLFFPGETHEGGELIISDDISQTIIKSSDFDDWTLVIFPIYMKHEVKHVTNGNRIVFETEYLTNYTEVEKNKEYIDEDLCD